MMTKSEKIIESFIRKQLNENGNDANRAKLKKSLEDALHYLGYIRGLEFEDAIKLQSAIEKFMKSVNL